ncbi:MAG: FtsW/RodA/SpoVE family cell cycle protein [bacterium]|nr:FtsW/RodA/SpoVE family cell cycle protein [bacterium]MDE0287825.1 FtsW/RodA/SpoVE family cell cycle protein [bacterium]MDE0438316.1 FtsW/RodA/SpoVE family cell cycle protein [bacterium]
MSRTAEAVLVLAAAALAAFGVLLVNFARGVNLNADTPVTLLVFITVFGGLLAAVRSWAPRSVPFLIPLAATLTAVGFVILYRLDHHLAGVQRWWLLSNAGLAALWLFSVRTRGIRSLARHRYVLLAVAAVLASLPLIPAVEGLPVQGLPINGSRLWVEWYWGVRIRFQSGEVARLLLVVFLASFLSEHQTALSAAGRTAGRFRLPQPRGLLPAGVAWIASLGILLYLRDLGASLLLAGVVLTMLYIATNRPSYLATGAGLVVTGVLVAYFVVGHVGDRIDAWFDPWANLDGAGLQTVQGLFALAAGSLSGTGLGLGEPDLIPAATTGFVFAAAGEELGLAGSVVVLAAYALLVATGFGIALRARDLFRKLLAAGLSLTLGLQTLLVVAGVLRILPVTGMTAPFMSAGGSSTVAGFLLLALLARTSHEERT